MWNKVASQQIPVAKGYSTQTANCYVHSDVSAVDKDLLVEFPAPTSSFRVKLLELLSKFHD